MHGDSLHLWWFGGWLLAVGGLFAAALQAPVQTRLTGLPAALLSAGVVAAFMAVAVLANLALALHDRQFDLTRAKIHTPAARALAVVDRLAQPIRLVYFYQGSDALGRRAKGIVEAMGRRNRLLQVRTVDPDREPRVAADFGIQFYNVAAIENGERRVFVRSTDENDIAIGIQRVLREQVINLCFIEGHHEYPVNNFEFHSHLEGFAGHGHGDADSAVVETTGHGVGRLRRALEALGYDIRAITPANAAGIPADCAVVVDAGPRTTYVPAESVALERYLRGGGGLLLMYDLGFVLEPGLERLLATLGVRMQPWAVVDSPSHYGTDAEMVAVTSYDPHAITRDVSFTFYPGVRALEIGAAAASVHTAPLVQSSAGSDTRAVAPVPAREPRATATPERPDAGPRAHVLAAAIDGTLVGPDARPFRAVVIGDADFASNSFFPYVANSDLALAMVRWLVREEHNAPVAARVPAPTLVLLTKRQMQVVFVLVEILLPLAVVAVGGWIWWRRR